MPGRTVRTTIALMAASVVALVAVGGILATPRLEAAGSVWGGFLRTAYSPACHQMADRSLHVSGRPLAVCARCTGLYAGGLAGLILGGLLGPLRRWPKPVWLLWAFAPSLIDFGAGFVGLPSLPNVPRAIVAFPPGAVIGVFLAVGITDIVRGSSGREDDDPAPIHATVEEVDG